MGLRFSVGTLDRYIQLALPLSPSSVPQTQPIYQEGPWSQMAPGIMNES